MNLRKAIFKSKRGSYIVEAAMSLPVFILCVISLALIVRIISGVEQTVFEQCLTLHEMIMQAPEVFPSAKSERYRITNFDYLYTDSGIHDLIRLDSVCESNVKNPIGIDGQIDYELSILSRAFTGERQVSQTLSVSDFESGKGSETVIVFPKYGERFHRPGCRYTIQEYEGEEEKLEMQRMDAEMKGYTPCLICGGG